MNKNKKEWPLSFSRQFKKMHHVLLFGLMCIAKEFHPIFDLPLFREAFKAKSNKGLFRIEWAHFTKSNTSLCNEGSRQSKPSEDCLNVNT